MSRFFMRAVASHGFVVVAPLHTGNLFADPNCRNDNAAQHDSFVNRPPDIMFEEEEHRTSYGDPRVDKT
jgi:hypothetical protein